MSSPFLYTRTDEVLIDIDNVTVKYGDNVVLKNLSAQIKNITRPGMQQGQIVGMLGPSGIGKSTLFRVLAGLMQPDEGAVRIGLTGAAAEPGMVGVVAQNYPLLEHRTVLDNLVRAARKASGTNKKDAEAVAKESLASFGLADHADKYPIQLSGGQRQRAAIAQQLLCSSHYLVMDEPFSGLDVVALHKVQNMLLEVSQRNEQNTIIVVTHDVTAAVTIADTVWLMGRDRDAEGNVIPGARIMEEIDLVERGLCWQPDIASMPACVDLIREIKNRFEIL